MHNSSRFFPFFGGAVGEAGAFAARPLSSHWYRRDLWKTNGKAKYSELLSILPPKRRPWQSEDYRMTIFDAAAVGIAYFADNTPSWEHKPAIAKQDRL